MKDFVQPDDEQTNKVVFCFVVMMPIVRFGDGRRVQRAGSARVCARVSCGVTSGVPTLSTTPGLIVTAAAAAEKKSRRSQSSAASFYGR